MNGRCEIGETVLNDWKLIRLLGEGIYGKVYGVQRKGFGNTSKSAIKLITIPRSKSEIAVTRNRHMNTASNAEVASMIDQLIYPDHRLGRSS